MASPPVPIGLRRDHSHARIRNPSAHTDWPAPVRTDALFISRIPQKSGVLARRFSGFALRGGARRYARARSARLTCVLTWSRYVLVMILARPRRRAWLSSVAV